MPRLGPNVDADLRVATPNSKLSGSTFPSNLDLYLFGFATGVCGLEIKAWTHSGSTSVRAHVVDMSSVRRTTTCGCTWLHPSWIDQDPSLLYPPVDWKGLKGKAPMEKATIPWGQKHLETRPKDNWTKRPQSWAMQSNTRCKLVVKRNARDVARDFP